MCLQPQSLSNTLLDLAGCGVASSPFSRNSGWIALVFGWYCSQQPRCPWRSSVAGILKICIVSLSTHSSWHWKVSYLGLSLGWTLCAFMYSTNALCSPCSSRLDLEEVAREKCVQHICWFFIPWLEVWLCFLAYCCSRAGGEQLPTCSRRTPLLSLLSCTSSGGASSRHLQ